MRITREELNSQLVKLISMRSQCKRKQVGAIILWERRIISTGYNGPVYGEICNNCKPGCFNSIHAELNAILFAARYGISLKYTTMLVANGINVSYNDGVAALM